MRKIFSIALAFALSFSFQSFADEPDMPRDGHKEFHEVYKNWTNSKGQSCCNEKDCQPVEYREVYKNGRIVGYQMHFILKTASKTYDRWHDIPYNPDDPFGKGSVLRPYPSPDFNAHACYGLYWFENVPYPIFHCFILPGNS